MAETVHIVLALVTTCRARAQVQVMHLLQYFPQAIVDVVAFSILGAIGQLFIYHSIAEFGTLTTTTICITRCVGMFGNGCTLLVHN